MISLYESSKISPKLFFRFSLYDIFLRMLLTTTINRIHFHFYSLNLCHSAICLRGDEITSFHWCNAVPVHFFHLNRVCQWPGRNVKSMRNKLHFRWFMNERSKLFSHTFFITFLLGHWQTRFRWRKMYWDRITSLEWSYFISTKTNCRMA